MEQHDKSFLQVWALGLQLEQAVLAFASQRGFGKGNEISGVFCLFEIFSFSLTP